MFRAAARAKVNRAVVVALYKHSHKRFIQSSESNIFNQLQSLSEVDATDYQKIKTSFNLETPPYFNFAGDIVDEWAKQGGTEEQQLAFWYVGSDGTELKWSFSELSRRSQKAANSLAATGATQTWKRFLLILPKIPEWWLLNLAAFRLGVELIPATTMLTANDIKYRLLATKAECIITNDVIAPSVDQVIKECPNITTKIMVSSGQIQQARSGWQNYHHLFARSSDNHRCSKTKSEDTSQLFFTSGTTGLPKIVVHTHGSLSIGHFFLGRFTVNLNRRDVHWNIADTGWAKTAWSSLYAPWMLGSCVFIHQMPRFDPLQAVQVLQKYPISSLCAPPTAYRMMLAQNMQPLPDLKRVFSAGEPLNAEVINKWKDITGLVIREGYGQTETSVLCANFPGQVVKPGSMGLPAPYLHMSILGDDAKELPPNKEGNIGVRVKPKRPHGLFKEYENDPDRMAANMVGDYYLTGDRGYKDDDGYFWFVGRADDVITSAGYRIGPFEIESALQEHPAVLESAAVASPDDKRGQIVKAFVVLREKFKATYKANPDKLTKELQDHVKTVTAPYKYPRKIEYVDSLPKTISGKIKRADLRQQEMKKASK